MVITVHDVMTHPQGPRRLVCTSTERPEPWYLPQDVFDLCFDHPPDYISAQTDAGGQEPLYEIYWPFGLEGDAYYFWGGVPQG